MKYWYERYHGFYTKKLLKAYKTDAEVSMLTQNGCFEKIKYIWKKLTRRRYNEMQTNENEGCRKGHMEMMLKSIDAYVC